MAIDSATATKSTTYSECRVIGHTHVSPHVWTSFTWVGTPGKGGVLVPQTHYVPEQWFVSVEVDGAVHDAEVEKIEWDAIRDGDAVHVYRREGLLTRHGYEADQKP